MAGVGVAALRGKAGLAHVEFTQLNVFDALDRDERGRELSVGHSGALASERIPYNATLVPVVDGTPDGAPMFDHDVIMRLAVTVLRRQYTQEIDPAGLLHGPFTAPQLRRIYQAVYGHALMKDTFRRIVAPHLAASGELANDFGRPAELFRKIPGSLLPGSARATFVDPPAR